MSFVVYRESPDFGFTEEEMKRILYSALDGLGERHRILAVPPDYTRLHSQAGKLTALCRSYYGSGITDILPALGTHSPMTDGQIAHMFPGVPKDLFRVHDWRNDVITLGEVPAGFVEEVSDGLVSYPWPAQVNRMLPEGGWDLILSIGQVVPHEVIGMANYNKNIFVGTGGPEGINKSHFLGAAYGMERIMARIDTPVRRVLNYASQAFARNLPIVYILTVIGKNANGALVVKGLSIGDDIRCFERAAELSRRENLRILKEPIRKIVVYLDPSEYKSTWLGNKAVYRTRMAIADGGELIILAPGLKEFGEDAQIDRLIRKYGYRRRPEVLALTEDNEDLRNNLGVAAHLIHGSSEGRFTVTYCPGFLSKEEIEGVYFRYGDCTAMMHRYNPDSLIDGWNTTPEGDQIFYISNPALGLWACEEKWAN